MAVGSRERSIPDGCSRRSHFGYVLLTGDWASYAGGGGNLMFSCIGGDSFFLRSRTGLHQSRYRDIYPLKDTRSFTT